MEAISLKLDEHMLKNVDGALKEHNYSTRTEFIRDAIREKLNVVRREEIMNRILDFHGSAKSTGTKSQNKNTAEKVLRELANENGWNLD